MRTDVYLDVDGALNVLGQSRNIAEELAKAGWPGAAQTDRAELGMDSYPIRWSPHLIRRINALSAREDVQFHWLTTWRDFAPKILPDMMGIDGEGWPVLGHREYLIGSAGEWWKLSTIRRHASTHENRIVWIDDDLDDRDAREWAAGLGDRILCVQPDPRRGITLGQMDFIEGWVQ